MSAEQATPRVLMVTNSLAPQDGGTTRSVCNAALAHQLAGTARVTLAYGSEAGGKDRATVASLAADGLNLMPLRSRLRHRRALRLWAVSAAAPWRLIRSAKHYDVVQIHGAWHWPSLWGAVAARVAGVPCLLQPHETLTEFDVATSQNAVTRRLKMLALRFYKRTVDFTVFSSELERRDSVAVTASTVVAHPVVRATGGRSTRVRGRAVKFGFLGRFHPKKRVEVLLEAFARLRSSGVLILAGSGPHEGAIRRRAAELALGDSVEWRGFIPAEAVPEFLEQIDVLVMPSTYECFGMSAAEALAQARPVIITRRVGLAKLVAARGGGWVVGETVEELTKAMEAALDPVDRADRGAAALAAAESTLTFDAYARALAGIYERLLSTGEPTHS